MHAAPSTRREILVPNTATRRPRPSARTAPRTPGHHTFDELRAQVNEWRSRCRTSVYYVVDEPAPPTREVPPDDVIDGEIYAGTIRDRLDEVEARVLAPPPPPRRQRRAAALDADSRRGVRRPLVAPGEVERSRGRSEPEKFVDFTNAQRPRSLLPPPRRAGGAGWSWCTASARWSALSRARRVPRLVGVEWNGSPADPYSLVPATRDTTRHHHPGHDGDQHRRPARTADRRPGGVEPGMRVQCLPGALPRSPRQPLATIRRVGPRRAGSNSTTAARVVPHHMPSWTTGPNAPPVRHDGAATH